MNTDAEFNELCQREIVKIRELTLKDDEYTGGLLGDAVGSPVGITLCVEARMKQVAQQQATIAALEAKLQAAEGLVAEHAKLMTMAAEAELMRGIARAASNETDRLHTILDNSGTTDRRTKEWKDYNNSNQFSNRAWQDFNQIGVRNIGLEVCNIYRKEATAAYEQAAGGSSSEVKL